MTQLRTYNEPHTGDTVIQTRISQVDVAVHGDMILKLAVEKVADAIAERYLADHMQEIVSLIDQQAVANLAVADAAGAIREQLAKKLPDKIVEVVRTEREVYQRGVFGGMKRIR
jgi:hypothetical protein